MKKGLKRGVSLFITMLMVITTMPVSVLAEDLNMLNEKTVNQESVDFNRPKVLTNSLEVENPDQVMEASENEGYLSQQESVEASSDTENWHESKIDDQKTQIGTDQMKSSYNDTLKIEIDQTLEVTQTLQTSAVENEFEYIDYNDGVSIFQYTGAGVNIIVPETLGGKKVLMIGEGAFYNNGILQSVSLPSGVKKIDLGAFYLCENLTTIALPNGLSEIGEGAFLSCTSLTDITLPDSVTTIESSAFAGCTALTSIVIPNAVSAINDGTFASCESLKDITLSNSLTTIGICSFQLCTSLTGITLPDTVISIGEGAFNDCSEITTVTLPDSVTIIGDGAFSGCSGLASIILSNSLTSLSSGLFYNCTSLASIILPNTITTIGDSTFEGCYSLSTITLPNNITMIGESAFQGCKSLTSITIPNNITIIKAYTFGSCEKLVKIVISPNVTTIEDNAVKNSNNITIYCTKNSYAEAYANKNNIPFIIDESIIYINSFTTDKLSVQYVNTEIKLDAKVTGGIMPYQYKFYCKMGTDTTVIQEYGATSTATFKPENPGIYTLYVDVKDTDGNVATKSIENYNIVFKCTYQTHVQNVGWQGWKNEGEMSGTSGQGLRLEGIEIDVANQGYDIGADYRTQIENIGWQGWKANGEMSGTSGKALRLEAIQIKLNGSDADKYDIYYQVHAENIGWMGWAKNGESAGTEGFSYRLEAIKIVVVPKDTPAPGTTIQPFVKAGSSTEETPSVSYQTHVQNIGWQGWRLNGDISGTSGKSFRLEGIEIKTNDEENVGVEYQTHVQNIGWQGWKANGAMSGTSGKSLRLEAIQMKLTGADAEKYDIYYQVHAENYGWLDWANNGESAGTEGFGYRLEAIKIVMVPKGAAAPGMTKGPFVKK